MASKLNWYSRVVFPQDIDIFATSSGNAETLVSRLEKADYRIDSHRGNVWHIEPCGFDDRMSIQVVEPKPEWRDGDFVLNVLQDFDLAQSRALLTSQTCVKADSFIGYCEGRILRINNPLRTMKRIMKYHKRGVNFDDLELIKLFCAWDSLTDVTKSRIIASAYPNDDPEDYDWYNEDDWFEGE